MPETTSKFENLVQSKMMVRFTRPIDQYSAPCQIVIDYVRVYFHINMLWSLIYRGYTGKTDQVHIFEKLSWRPLVIKLKYQHV